MANVRTSTGRRSAPMAPKSSTKSEMVQTRVSPEEAKRWRRRAKIERVTLSHWMRSHLTAEADQNSIGHERAALVAMRVVVNRVIDTIEQRSADLPPSFVEAIGADLAEIRAGLVDVVDRQMRRARR